MNWQTLVQKECGVIASQEEIDAHMQQARDKLARIIRLKGIRVEKERNLGI